MRKSAIFIFSALVILVLIGIFSWNMVPSWVSSKLSDRAKVSVSIGDIHLGTSSITVNKISVGNPPKSILKKALEVKKLFIDVPFTRFFKDKIVIDEMQMKNVYVGLEFDSPKRTTGNWSQIMKNLKSSTDKDKKKAAAEGSTKSVLIKKLIITDLNIDLAYRSDGKVRSLRKIDRIELNNISSEGGIPTAQIMDIIMSEMLRNIFSPESLKNLMENILPGKGSSPVEGLKGLFSDLIQLDNDWDLLYDVE